MHAAIQSVEEDMMVEDNTLEPDHHQGSTQSWSAVFFIEASEAFCHYTHYAWEWSFIDSFSLSFQTTL
jgi:hypothetical protein